MADKFMRLIFMDMKHPNPGGAENLVYTLIRSNFLKNNVQSVIFGEESSFVVKRLESDRIPYALYDRNNWNAFEPLEEDLYIHFSNNEWLPRVRRFPGRAIIWGILPSLIYSWNRFEFEKKIYGKKFFAPISNRILTNNLMASSAIYCMDGSTRDSINASLGSSNRYPLLPVPITQSDLERARLNSIKDKNICVSYVGRSGDVWKIYPLLKVCKDLSKLSGYRFTVNVYTDDKRPFLDLLCCQNSINTNISLNFLIGYWGESLRDHLSLNSDIHFSMGLSALEGGYLKIPTILLDASYTDLPEDYKYQWLYQTHDFSLGRFLDGDSFGRDGLRMSDVLEAYLDQEQNRQVSIRCFEYVSKNHTADKVLDNLSQCVGCSNLFISAHTPSSWVGS